MTTLLWAEPDLGAVSGGLRYNQQLRRALEDSGVRAPVLSLPGDWNDPLSAVGHSLADQLDAAAEEHDADAVVVDGLIGSACPELFVPGPSPRRRVPRILLVHLSAAVAQEQQGIADPEAVRRERLAVHEAGHVVTVSRWSAAELRRRYRRQQVRVALPGVGDIPEGVFPADRATPRLSCVSAFLPVKNHRLLGQALEPLLDRDWELTLAGPHSGSGYGQEVIGELRRRLPGRIDLRGTLTPQEVGALWSETDLLLLPSAAETYGMVVAEACAYGVPSFVSAGTGAEEAAGGAGAALDPQRPEEWTQALRQWLGEDQTRDRLRRAAVRRREHLPRWEDAAEVFRQLLS